jgi:hypothetical protein
MVEGGCQVADVLAMVDTVVRAAGLPLTSTSETAPVVVGDQVMVKALPAEMEV